VSRALGIPSAADHSSFDVETARVMTRAVALPIPPTRATNAPSWVNARDEGARPRVPTPHGAPADSVGRSATIAPCRPVRPAREHVARAFRHDEGSRGALHDCPNGASIRRCTACGLTTSPM
jgi:hypothetical protein